MDLAVLTDDPWFSDGVDQAGHAVRAHLTAAEWATLGPGDSVSHEQSALRTMCRR